MSEVFSIAQDIADLLDTMPAWPDPPEVRAAWHRRRATVLRRIAALTDDPQHSRAIEIAEEAERFAASLDAQAQPGSGAGS